MSPTIEIVGSYRFYFNSNEETRMHVHVRGTEGKAKFWLEPIVALAESHGFKPHELNELHRLVETRKESFENAWRKHFNIP